MLYYRGRGVLYYRGRGCVKETSDKGGNLTIMERSPTLPVKLPSTNNETSFREELLATPSSAIVLATPSSAIVLATPSSAVAPPPDSARMLVASLPSGVSAEFSMSEGGRTSHGGGRVKLATLEGGSSAR